MKAGSQVSVTSECMCSSDTLTPWSSPTMIRLLDPCRPTTLAPGLGPMQADTPSTVSTLQCTIFQIPSHWTFFARMRWTLSSPGLRLGATRQRETAARMYTVRIHPISCWAPVQYPGQGDFVSMYCQYMDLVQPSTGVQALWKHRKMITYNGLLIMVQENNYGTQNRIAPDPPLRQLHF